MIYFRGATNPVEDGPAALLKALAFFAMFGLASLAFWGHFQLERRPTARFAIRARPRPRIRTRPRGRGRSRISVTTAH